MKKKLVRSRTNRKLAGILGGISQYFGINAALLRILFAIAVVFTSFTLGLVYVLLIFILPNEGDGMIR
ncbi:PspC domain-containing protein [Peribacillus kribbensis]|uniref:PspC domain-containing protein n=1 Tax=Peribacillus kribbensis TaxID=356658 RepID=UPI00041F4B61